MRLLFFDALANNESAVRELGDDTLKKIAIEITNKLRKSTTVDWRVRDSVRAKLKHSRIPGVSDLYASPGKGEEFSLIDDHQN